MSNTMNLSTIIETIQGWNQVLIPSEYIAVKETLEQHQDLLIADALIDQPAQRVADINAYLDLIDQALDDTELTELKRQADFLNTKAIDTIKQLAWLTTQPLSTEQTEQLIRMICDSAECHLPAQAISTIAHLQNNIAAYHRELLGLHYQVGAQAIKAHHLTTGIPSEISEGINHQISALDDLTKHTNPELISECQAIIAELRAWASQTPEADYQKKMHKRLAHFKPAQSSIDFMLLSLQATPELAPNNSRLSAKMIALNQQLTDLVTRVTELEDYAYIDPSITADERWQACLDTLASLRSNALQLITECEQTSLSDHEQQQLAEMGHHIQSLGHLVDAQQAFALIRLVQSQEHTHDQLISLMTNPWLMAHLNNAKNTQLVEAFSQLTQNNIAAAADGLMVKSRVLFKNIPTEELFNLKSQQCPHYLAMTTFFNQISNFVSTDILTYKTTSERSACLAYWIQVMHQCYLQGDFYCVAAINAAFTSTPISRLEASWQGIPVKSQSIKREMEHLFDPGEQQKSLREAMESVAGAVPFIGPYRTMINVSNERLKGYKSKFTDVMECFATLNEAREFEQQADLLGNIGSVLAGIEKELKALPTSFVRVHEQLSALVAQMKASNGEPDIDAVLAQCRVQVASTQLSDFPEAIYRNQPVLLMQSNIVAAPDVVSELSIAIGSVKIGNEVDNDLYKLSKYLEPKAGEVAPSQLFVNVHSITSMQALDYQAPPTRLGALKNRTLQESIIRTGQVILASANDEDIERVNQCIQESVTEAQLEQRLYKLGLQFPQALLKVINATNKQLRYHQDIDSQSLQDAIRGMKLKSTTAGKLGGKSTKKRIDELTELARKGQLDRATLEYKLSKLVSGAQLSDEQYQNILADYDQIKAHNPVDRESKISKLGHQLWAYVKEHPFRAVGVAAAGAVALHAAPFIPLFGAKAYAVGASTGLGALFGGESIMSQSKEDAPTQNRHSFFRGQTNGREVTQQRDKGTDLTV